MEKTFLHIWSVEEDKKNIYVPLKLSSILVMQENFNAMATEVNKKPKCNWRYGNLWNGDDTNYVLDYLEKKFDIFSPFCMFKFQIAEVFHF